MKVSILVQAMRIGRVFSWFAIVASGVISAQSFRFAVLGDRTGEAVPGVYEQVWREIASEKPAFVLSVGDSIQGLEDAVVAAQWREFESIRARFRRLPLYLTPGNHDIWSEQSEQLYVSHARHGVHYSFDFKQAHFTILDNSRADGLSAGEMEFLASDLDAHAAQPVKFIVSHRPSWLVPVMLRDSDFALHGLAKRYGVKYVVAGHVHELMHFQLDGVTYVAAPSSGGHLRGTKKYEDGWLFGHMLAQVSGSEVKFQIREASAPHGEKRISGLGAWGMTGLSR